MSERHELDEIGLATGLDIIGSAKITRSLKNPLSIIHRFTKRSRGQCDAAEMTLAKACGVGDRQWRRIVRRLATLQFIECQQRSGQTSILSINFDALLKIHPNKLPKAGHAPIPGSQHHPGHRRLQPRTFRARGDCIPGHSGQTWADIPGRHPGHPRPPR